jgi:hypothetical protein
MPVSQEHWRSLEHGSSLPLLESLSLAGPQGFARETGTTEAALFKSTSRRLSGKGEPITRLLKAVSLDPERLSLTHPAAMRAMAVACSACDAKSLCRTDLDLHVSAATYPDYCRNAGTIDALRRETQDQPSR